MSESISLRNRNPSVVEIGTLLRFLRGDRNAILTIASAPAMLGVGFLFVLSAALAREYDGADLLAEPWRLLVPLGASLGTSFVLYCLMFEVARFRGIGHVPFWLSYLQSALYWMTAPLAWLYAIPVERFMTPLGATRANFALLAVVAVWRVWLMTCVVRALFGASRTAAWPIVLLFADVVALTAVIVMPKPIVALMGGIRHSDSENLILEVTFNVGLACVVTLPVWLIAVATTAARSSRWTFALTPLESTPRPSRGLGVLTVMAVAGWAFVLPLTQPQQSLARRVNADLKARRIAEAVQEMAQHERSDFPAHWDPPPHEGFGEKEPPMLDVMEVILANNAPAWVQALFTNKFSDALYNAGFLWGGVSDDQEFSRYVQVVKRLPEGPSFTARNEEWLTTAQEEPELSEARRADIKALFDLAKTYDPDVHPEDHFARSYPNSVPPPRRLKRVPTVGQETAGPAARAQE